MKIKGSIDVSGRGQVLICEMEEGEFLPPIGSYICYGNQLREIASFEMSRQLTSPATIKKEVGILLKRQTS